MSNERKSAVAPIVACVLTAIVFCTLAYAGGYFWLMMGPADVNAVGDPIRIYRWLACAFYPAAWLEGRATGHRVQLVGGDGEMLHQ